MSSGSPPTSRAEHFPSDHGYPPTPTSEQQFRPVFTQEELRVLRECNLESFYFRCVPLAAIISTATFVAIRKGILKQSQRFGYTPKMLAAGFIGYFAGKLSYQNACAEKLMQLPNSPIGEALRKKKGRLGFQEMMGIEPGFSVDHPSSEFGHSDSKQPIFDDHRPDQRDHSEGLVEYERGVTESLTPYTETPSTPQQHTSYQDLRRQNREEYVNKMTEKYRRPLGDSTPENDQSPLAPPPPPPQTYRPPSPPRTNVRKNQYGDEVYD